jgi:hypothetical protein
VPDRFPSVVNALSDRLHALLGSRLVGVYLGGSFVMDDFVEGSSDYDVLVIVADELSSTDLSRLTALHDRLLSEFPDAIRLEGDYVPRTSLRPEGTSEPAPFFRKGRLQPRRALMLSADNIGNFRYAGISVIGPPPSRVLPDVTPAQLRDAVRRMLREKPDPTTEQKAAGEILDLVRSYRALETGRPATKSDGLRWGLSKADPGFHPLLRRADAVRRGTRAASNDRTLRDGLRRLRTALQRRSPR